MIKININNIEFKLREYQDFNWVSKYGKVFSVIDATGSSCICFGVEKNDKKYFIKIAGAKTTKAEITEKESIQLLKDAVEIYKNIKHECLVKYIDSFEYKEFFGVIFEYAKGECLFDHWNFEKYENDKKVVAPIQKFKQLPVEKRLNVVSKLFSFFQKVIESGYVAVDFYDSSIIYDFSTDEVMFCDIDLFRKNPTKNDIGIGYYGTKRLKAPEENELGAIIDEKTNEFTLGAIIFDMFSTELNYKDRYKLGMFIPNKMNNFELSLEKYNILLRATNYDRNKRYNSIKEFEDAWNNSK